MQAQVSSPTVALQQPGYTGKDIPHAAAAQDTSQFLGYYNPFAVQGNLRRIVEPERGHQSSKSDFYSNPPKWAEDVVRGMSCYSGLEGKELLAAVSNFLYGASLHGLDVRHLCNGSLDKIAAAHHYCSVEAALDGTPYLALPKPVLHAVLSTHCLSPYILILNVGYDPQKGSVQQRGFVPTVKAHKLPQALGRQIGIKSDLGRMVENMLTIAPKDSHSRVERLKELRQLTELRGALRGYASMMRNGDSPSREYEQLMLEAAAIIAGAVKQEQSNSTFLTRRVREAVAPLERLLAK